jgi:hypothetical protein
VFVTVVLCLLRLCYGFVLRFGYFLGVLLLVCNEDLLFFRGFSWFWRVYCGFVVFCRCILCVCASVTPKKGK